MKIHVPDRERHRDLLGEQRDLIADVETLIRAGEMSGSVPSPKDAAAIDDALSRLQAIGEELDGLPKRRQRRAIAEKIGLLVIAQFESKRSHRAFGPHEYLRDVVRDPLLALISKAAVPPQARAQSVLRRRSSGYSPVRLRDKRPIPLMMV